MLFSCTWWIVKWNWCIEIVKGWYSVEEVFFVVLVEMRSSTYSVDILMYDIFWLSWFLESILPLFEPRGEIWLHLILNQERERRSWSGSARNLEFKNPSRGTYLLSFIPSFSQISQKFHKIWDEINWKISSTWAWSIYGKLIHENFMSTFSVLTVFGKLIQTRGIRTKFSLISRHDTRRFGKMLQANCLRWMSFPKIGLATYHESYDIKIK